MRKIHLVRRMNGLCKCGKLPEENRKMCRVCLDYAKTKVKRRCNKRRESGLCVDCGGQRDSYKKTCFKCLEKRNNVVRELRLEILNHYGRHCSCCGETEEAFLCIDHIYGNGNKHRREIKSQGGPHFYSWLKRHNYPDGFQVLCHNCNMAKGFYGKCPHQKSVFTIGK